MPTAYFQPHIAYQLFIVERIAATTTSEYVCSRRIQGGKLELLAAATTCCFELTACKAQAYLIDPINAPEPSAADGPGGSGFGSTFAPRPASIKSNSPSATSSRRPPRNESLKQSTPTKNGVSSSVRSANRSPPEKFPDYRADAFSDYESTHWRAASNGTPPSYQEATGSSDRPSRRRGSSLKERYPGDKSGEPLNIIRRDSLKAHRSPHLRKKNFPGADSIDRLDPAIGGRSYHHEGPYDAALLSRNRDPRHAPVAAVEQTNREALKATPRENIKDAVERHRPLDGVAVVPPGEQDKFGRTYNYEEGADLMREATTTDAGYKRWPGRVCTCDMISNEDVADTGTRSTTQQTSKASPSQCSL